MRGKKATGRGKTRTTTRKTATRRTATTRGGSRGGARTGFIRIHLGSAMKSWIADPEHRQLFNQWCLGIKPDQISGGRGRGRGGQGTGGQTGQRRTRTPRASQQTTAAA
jgi:hypothetical protein